MTKVYTIEGIYWLEEKYEAKEWYKDRLWKNEKDAIEALDKIKDNDDYNEIPVYVRHNETQYLVLIHPRMKDFITTNNEKMIKIFWKSEWAIWYRIKKVNLI